MSKWYKRHPGTENKEELNKSREYPISVDTVKTLRRTVGLNGRIACRKPLLGHINKTKRLQWVLEQ